MCKALKQFARGRRRVQHAGIGEQRPGPIARELEDVIASATRLTERWALHLAPRYDCGYRPVPFADRRDGAPCEKPSCAYAYVLVVPLRDLGRAHLHARHQLRPRATRYFVQLELDDACAMSCEALSQLDEAKLRSADPTAVEILRRLRDAGADVLFLRGILSARVAVVFRQSVGDRVRVADEAAETLDGDRWVRETPRPGASHEDCSALAPGRRWPRAGLRGRRMAWELGVALLSLLLAPRVVEAAGLEVTVPLWVGVLLAAMAAVLTAVAIHGPVAAATPPSAERRADRSPLPSHGELAELVTSAPREQHERFVN